MKSNFATRFGENVRAMRTAKRLSAKELAEDAGVSVGYLGEIERGERSISLVRAANIAWALGVPLSYLLPK